MGPLIDKSAVETMMAALEKLKEEGGKILYGGQKLEGSGYASGCYVTPALAEAENHYEIVQEETFAPILYLIKYKGDVKDAIKFIMGSFRDYPLQYLQVICTKQKNFFLPAARIVGLPM